MRRQENEKTSHKWGENICKNICNKILLSKIYKELLKFYNRKMNNPKKWAIEKYRHLTKEDIYMANSYMKLCSPSHVIRELPIKTASNSLLVGILKITIL